MKKTTVFDCSLINFNKIYSEKGSITAIQNLIDFPFNIKRIYYLYDIPGGEARGGHAHKTLEQIIIAVSGSFDLVLDDGNSKRTFMLSRPYYGVLLPSGLWRELNNFSTGSICLVLASEEYDEGDYIRDYNNFISFKNDT